MQRRKFNLVHILTGTNQILFRHPLCIRCNVKLHENNARRRGVSNTVLRAKTYLDRIIHASKLSNMNGGGLNHLPLVQGVKDSYIR